MRNYLTKLSAYAVPLLMLCALVVAALLGLAAGRLEARFAKLALASLSFLVLVFWGAEFALLGLLAMIATLFARVQLPGLFGFSVVEWGVYALLGLVLLQGWVAPNNKRFVQTPLDWPILLFIGFSLVSLLNGMYNLGTVLEFRNVEIRTVLMYSVFFIVTNLIRTRRQLMTLAGGMLIMGTVIACLMIVQQAAGSTARILPWGSVIEADALGLELADTARIILPGESLVFVMLFPAFLLRTTPGLRRTTKQLLLIPVVCLPLAVLFSFTRGLWIGAITSFSLFIVLARSQRRNLVFQVAVLVAVAALSIPLLSAYLPRASAVSEAVQLRFSSLFAGEKLEQDPSTQWRLKENELAIAKFKQYPFLGAGPSAEYRPSWFSGDQLMYYVHNSYLYFLVDFGLVGFLPFVVLSIVFIIRSLLYWPRFHDLVLKSLAVGSTLSYIAVLICSITNPRLLQMEYAIPIGIILGVNEVAIRLDQQTKKPTEVQTFPMAQAWS